MEPKQVTEKQRASIGARIGFWMGLGSLLAMPVSAILGYVLEELGMMQLCISLICPAALVGIVLGILQRKKAEEPEKGKRLALAGLVMGAVSIGLIFLLILLILLIFLPGVYT